MRQIAMARRCSRGHPGRVCAEQQRRWFLPPVEEGALGEHVAGKASSTLILLILSRLRSSVGLAVAAGRRAVFARAHAAEPRPPVVRLFRQPQHGCAWSRARQPERHDGHETLAPARTRPSSGATSAKRSPLRPPFAVHGSQTRITRRGFCLTSSQPLRAFASVRASRQSVLSRRA